MVLIIIIWDWNAASNYPDDGVEYCGLAGAECTLETIA